MYCKSCGAKIEKTNKYCTECGTLIERKEEKEKVEDPEVTKANNLCLISLACFYGFTLLKYLSGGISILGYLFSGIGKLVGLGIAIYTKVVYKKSRFATILIIVYIVHIALLVLLIILLLTVFTKLKDLFF